MENIKIYSFNEFVLRDSKNLNINVNINEGVKDWLLSGLLTLTSMAGMTQMKQNLQYNPQKVKAAKEIQNRLEKGDRQIINLFDEIDIDYNKENLNKLLKVDPKKTKMNIFKTGNERILKRKLEQGWTLTDLGAERDTKLPKGSKLYITDTITLDYESDALFKTAGYELTEEYIEDLKNVLNEIEKVNGEITNIRIESSTDTEPIRMSNEKLAHLRAEMVKKALNNIGGIDSISINTKPNQGPDIYSKTMSPDERIEARDKTSEFRYVRLHIEYIKTETIETLDIPKEPKIIYKYELVRPIEDKTIGTYKFKGKSAKRKKHPRCEIKIKDVKTECPKW